MGRLSKKIKLQDNIIKRLTKNSIDQSNSETCESGASGSVMKHDESYIEDSSDTVCYCDVDILLLIIYICRCLIYHPLTS